MAAISLPLNPFLGAIVQSFPKVQYAKVKEIIDKLNVISTTNGALKADSITESTALADITVNSALIEKHATAAINSTATATAAQVKTGWITSTSAAATTITLPTGTLLGTALGAVAGTSFDLYIDNTAGANTVTIAVAVNGISSAWQAQLIAATASVTPAALSPLDVVSGVTGLACFRLMFSSATAYDFCRIA